MKKLERLDLEKFASSEIVKSETNHLVGGWQYTTLDGVENADRRRKWWRNENKVQVLNGDGNWVSGNPA